MKIFKLKMDSYQKFFLFLGCTVFSPVLGITYDLVIRDVNKGQIPSLFVAFLALVGVLLLMSMLIAMVEKSIENSGEVASYAQKVFVIWMHFLVITCTLIIYGQIVIFIAKNVGIV